MPSRHASVVVRLFGALLLLLASVPFASAAIATDTQPISAKALTSHSCDESEWHFLITSVADAESAPASIEVSWADGGSATVALEGVTGGTAHYRTAAHLSSTVTSATASVYAGWSGQFNLSHGPCGEADGDDGEDGDGSTGGDGGTGGSGDEEQVVTVTAPGVVEDCDQDGAVVTITAAAHVTFTLNGNVVAAGQHLVDADASGSYQAVVKAKADAGYTIDGKTRWDLSGTMDCQASGDNGSTTTISAKALTDHECNDSEWHFVITGLESDAQAPASITVTFTGGATMAVTLEKVTGGTAHYRTTEHLDLQVVSATADIKGSWSGQFNLSHGPCAETGELPGNTVTAGMPSVDGNCEKQVAVVTIPATAHVVYRINGSVAAAGVHEVAVDSKGHYTVVVTATAEAGWTLQGTSSWELSAKLHCGKGEDNKVLAGEPKVQVDCDAKGVVVTIPTTAHVSYMINGSAAAAGTHPVAADGQGKYSVTVTAAAESGYKLTGQSTFTFTGTLSCGSTQPPVGSAMVSISLQPCTSGAATAVVHVEVPAGAPSASYVVSSAVGSAAATSVGTLTLPDGAVRSGDVTVALVEDIAVRITVTSGATVLKDVTLTADCSATTVTPGTPGTPGTAGTPGTPGTPGTGVAGGGVTTGGVTTGSPVSDDTDDSAVLGSKAGSSGGAPGVLASTGSGVAPGLLVGTGIALLLLGGLMLLAPRQVLVRASGRHRRTS